MVFITGDCHANFHKFSSAAFSIQKEMTRDDIVIVCGDFGIWHDNNEERYWRKWLSKKNFTIVFVDGNHENFDRLYSDEFPIVDFHGGKAHQIEENIFHLMRGCMFEFEGKKFWCFGGASSHDIQDGILDRDNFESDEEFYDTIKRWYAEDKWFRVNHVSWWEQELPTQEELDFGLKVLEENGNKCDYIISHCCPQELAIMLGYREPDILTNYFNTIAHTVQFDKWYFGHYHRDEDIMSKFTCLYHVIDRLI